MTNILRNTLTWWAWLWVCEYASNWKVSQVVNYIKDAVTWNLSSTWPILNQTMVWAAAPFALAWYAWYKWLQEIKNSNVWNWVQRWCLTYWIPWVAAWALWLLTVPLAPQMLAAGAWMYWIKKLTWAIKDSVSKVWELPGAVASMPKKAWDGVKWIKLFWWDSWTTPAA